MTAMRYVVPLLSSVLACSGTHQPLPPPGDTLANGTWGGDSAAAIVSDSGTHVHINCTYGDLVGPVPLSGGAFDQTGSYMPRAYPVAVGPAVPARFVGRVAGATLTLTVTVNDTVQHQTLVFGPVSVVYDETPRMGPCPICRRPRWGGRAPDGPPTMRP